MIREILSLEQVRMVAVSLLSTMLAFFTPTSGFVVALVIAFGFSIFCGMRADGVTIVRCENFKMKKFLRALWLLLLYMMITEIIFSIMTACGDKEAAMVAVKSLTYVFCYVYICQGFRNLVIAYPKERAFHIVYHIIRLEFQRAMPGRVAEIVKRYEEGENKKTEDNNSEE